MRSLALALLVVNVALAAYLATAGSRSAQSPNVAALELNPGRVKVVGRGDALPRAGGAKQAGMGACLEWGIFSPAELERAQAALAAAQVSVRVRTAEAAPLWLVYIPPLRSRDEADRRLRELEELGVPGARVLTDERWRNAIQLGAFTAEAAALAYQQRMRDAKVRNVALAQRTDGARPALIVVADPAPATAEKLVGLKPQFAGTELRALACDPNGS